ncbi:guanylate kinase [Ligilactobacillus sp. LYQ135]
MKRLIILCGASGTGKTTIQNYLKERYQMPRVITHTTRAMRRGEQNGVDYYFETDESFAKNHYFESVNYDGKKYGSSKEALVKAWEKHDFVTLVVDTAGAIKYVKQLGKKVAVLHVQVQDITKLKKRMLKRGDQLAIIEKRINSKESQRDRQIPEILKPYSYIVNNDNWDDTKRSVDTIIQKIKCKK